MSTSSRASLGFSVASLGCPGLLWAALERLGALEGHASGVLVAPAPAAAAGASATATAGATALFTFTRISNIITVSFRFQWGFH